MLLRKYKYLNAIIMGKWKIIIKRVNNIIKRIIINIKAINKLKELTMGIIKSINIVILIINILATIENIKIIKWNLKIIRKPDAKRRRN